MNLTHFFPDRRHYSLPFLGGLSVQPKGAPLVCSQRKSPVKSFHRVSNRCWAILGATLLATYAHAQMEFDGEFNVFAKTESNEMLVLSESPNNGDGAFLFSGSGPHTRTVILPEDVLSGDKRGIGGFSFSPNAKTEVTFDSGDLEVIAEASVTLNGTVLNDETSEYGYYPESSADLNMQLKDGIQLYPEDIQLYGKRANIEWVGDVTVSRRVVVNSSDTTQAQSAIDFSVGTPLGIDEYEGSLRETRDEGEPDIQSDGPTDLSTPKTVVLDRALAILGPPPLDEFGSEFNNFRVDVTASARVWTSGTSGATFQAEVTLNVTNIRIQRITLQEDGSEISLSQLKSISNSGYDWLGNGEPEEGPVDGHHWDNPNGGVFGVAENWFDTNANGEADDVPEAEDTAVFDLPSSYSITLAQNHTIDNLFVSGDDTNITFNPDGKTLTIEDDLIVGARFEDNATLNISGAEIRVADSTILGDQGNGTLNVTHSNALSTDKLIVGGANSEILVSGSTATTNGSFLEIASELDLRVGSITVESSTTTGLDLNAQLSFGSINQENSSMLMHPGTSALFRDGGKSISQIMDLVVGYTSNGNPQPGAATAILTVDGGIETGESTLSWQPSEFTGIVGSMKIGQNSPGLVHVRNGGRFGFPISNIDDGAEESLAIDGSASGELLVEGVSPTGDPSIASFDSLRIGSYDAESPTSTTIRNGGRLELGKAEVYGTSGGLFVEGSNSGVVSEIVIAQSLETLNGTIEATDGGQITFLEKLHIETQERGRILIEGGSSIVGPIEPLENDESFLNLLTISNTEHVALTISGVDSQGNSSRLEIQGEGDQASIIGNGLVDSGIVTASVQAGGLLNLPERPLAIGAGGPGKLVVQGVDAASGNRSRVVTDLLLASPEAVDRIFTSSIQIQDGGLVHSRRGELDMGSDTIIEGTFGETVSELRIEEDLILGDGDTESQNEGIITLIGGQVNVGQNLTVKPQGRIFGNGTLSTPVGGVSNQGYIAPGLSPGSLHIEGDFTQEASGTLEMEIFGPNPEDQDRITVTGDATLAGTLLIVFGGHEPSANDQYPLLEVTGDLVEQDLAMEFAGLQPGFEARCEVIDGQLTLIAETDGQALVNDEPFTIPTNQIDASGNIGFRFYGFAGMTYTFETSTDLETWIPIATEEGENSLIDFHYGTNGAEQRFYRFTITANGE